MKTTLSLLKEMTGVYVGKGVNHEGQNFNSQLTLEPIVGDRGFRLSFKAIGLDGRIYHQEESMIAPSFEEKLVLWNFNSNTPGLLPHELRKTDVKPGALASLVFGFNNPSDQASFREDIALDVWDQESLSYTYSWGMPVTLAL